MNEAAKKKKDILILFITLIVIFLIGFSVWSIFPEGILDEKVDMTYGELYFKIFIIFLAFNIPNLYKNIKRFRRSQEKAKKDLIENN